MKNIPWLFVGLPVLYLLSQGCAGPSRVAMDYGNSVRLARVNQTLEPAAGKNLEPLAGLDGQAADFIMDRYRKGFQKPPAAPTYTFNIGK